MMRSTESLMSLVVFDRLYHLPTLYYRMRSTESLESLVARVEDDISDQTLLNFLEIQLTSPYNLGLKMI
jgi:hypothetical protein